MIFLSKRQRLKKDKPIDDMTLSADASETTPLPRHAIFPSFSVNPVSTKKKIEASPI
jgi:hypothetical protein